MYSVPQGPVLGLLECIAHMKDNISITAQIPVVLHQYANGMRLCMSSKLADISSIPVPSLAASTIIKHGAQCVKTELIWFGSRTTVDKIANQTLSLLIGIDNIPPVDTV
jgi:hypothetical protein